MQRLLVSIPQPAPTTAVTGFKGRFSKAATQSPLKQKEKALFGTQFGYLFGRASKNAVRNPFVIKAKAGQTIVFALIIGLLFQGTGGDLSYSGFQNRNGLLFFCVINNVMSSTIGVLSIFGEEKNVFSREHGAGYYGLPAYFISKIIVELPFQIIFPWIFSLIVYWFVGLQNVADKYFLFALFIILSSCCGFSLGIAIASIFENLEQALRAAPLILMPLMLFSGLFVNNGAIPPYFDWIKYISPMKYAYEGIIKNEMGGLFISCRPQNSTPLSGDECLADLGFNDQFTILVCGVCLLAMAVLLILLSYFCLVRVVMRHGKGVVPVKVAKVNIGVVG